MQRGTVGVDRSSLGLIAIVLVAFGIRLVLAKSQTEFAHWPDGEYYLSIARNLLHSGEYRNGAGPFPLAPLQSDVGFTSFWLPGYPLVLAGSFWLFGATPVALFVVQALLGTLTVLVTGLLGLRLGGRPVGLCAAALVAISPLQLAQVTRVASETLAALLFVVIAWLLVRVLDRVRSGAPRFLDLALLGAAVGFGILSRSAFVLTGACAFGVLAVHARRYAPAGVAARDLALVAAVAGLVLLPWFVRNWIVWDEFVYQTKSGVNLAIGFNDTADGRYSTRSLPDVERMGLDELERDRLLTARARDWIVTHPGRAASLGLQKAVMFWSPLHDRHPLSSPAGLITLLWSAPLLLASIVQTALIARSRRAEWLPLLLLTGAYALTHVAAFYASRFRVPVEPVLALLTSTGLVAVSRRWTA